jgi:UDP-N-acetylmuramate: L-alanyl-gamma-D-glutamyl-meso-diaminopimelate ligase
MNALAALVAADAAGVDVARALPALETFRSVARRMELVGDVGGIRVYDDFAHHPTAFETTIAGLRRRAGRERIVAVFEPRSNTMKLGTMQSMLAQSLTAADVVFCYAKGLGWEPSGALAPLGARAFVFHDMDPMVDSIAELLHPGDHVLVMSNGGFGGVHEKLLARLAPARRDAA